MFANCFPKGIKNDHFNTTQGEHNYVEYAVDFSTTKYEGIDVNYKAKTLLRTYQVLVNSLEFSISLILSSLDFVTGLTKTVNNLAKNKRGYDSTDGKLKDQDEITYRTKPNAKVTTTGGNLDATNVTTASNTLFGEQRMNGELDKW